MSGTWRVLGHTRAWRMASAVLVVVAAVAGGIAAAPSAGAAGATKTWDGVPDGGGASANASWMTATNWVGDTAPTADDILVFPNTAAVKTSTNNFPAGTAFAALRIGTVGSGSGHTLGGNRVVTSEVTAGSIGNTVNLAIDLPSDGTVTSTGELTLNGAFGLAGHALTATGPGSIVLKSVGGAGSGSTIVVGGGSTPQVTIGVSSSPAGGVRVDSGQLTISGSIAANVTLNGGTLKGTAGGRAVSITASGVGGTLDPTGLRAGSVALSSATHVVGAPIGSDGGISLGNAALDIPGTWCGACSPGMSLLLARSETTNIVGQFAGLAPGTVFQRDGHLFEIVSAGSSLSVVVRSAQASASRSGYWMLGSTGSVYAFGDAQFFGSQPGTQAAAIASTPSGNGYLIVTRSGEVRAYGDAIFQGSAPPLPKGEEVTTIAIHPGARGYWLFTNRGRVIALGVGHFGDMSAVALNGPVVASAVTPTGAGYYMVGSDGGIFAFGDARFHGSMGGQRLNGPVVGIAPDPDGAGYWLVATDGGIFAFDAGFRGSMGGTRLNRAVIGMVAYGDGYLMVASDGGIFNFSSKPFAGSLGSTPPANPIVGVTPLLQ